MYAVIRAGGKQYRVAPGDVIRVEKFPSIDGPVEFSDVLAVSGEAGQIGKPQSPARVLGEVVEQGRAHPRTGDSILSIMGLMMAARGKRVYRGLPARSQDR